MAELRFCIILILVFFLDGCDLNEGESICFNEIKQKQRKKQTKKIILILFVRFGLFLVSIFKNIERYCIQREKTSRKIKDTTSQSNKIHFFRIHSYKSKYIDQWNEHNFLGLHVNSDRKNANQESARFRDKRHNFIFSLTFSLSEYTQYQVHGYESNEFEINIIFFRQQNPR